MSDATRLNKRLSQLGYCSRREADEYILKNWILVNGQVAHLGQKVYSQDIIEIKHQARHSPVSYTHLTLPTILLV